MEKKERTTDRLEKTLCSSGAERLDDFFEKNAGILIDSDRPFTDFMREKMREKGISQKDVLIAAGISDKYGRKLISGDSHTSDRDKILRICLGAHLNLEETQKALKLYGLSPLYARVYRDAILIAAIGNRIFEISEIDELLIAQGSEPLSSDEPESTS